MQYLNKSFTLPTTMKRMTDLEYKLRVGLLSQEEFEVELKNALTETKKSSGNS